MNFISTAVANAWLVAAALLPSSDASATCTAADATRFVGDFYTAAGHPSIVPDPHELHVWKHRLGARLYAAIMDAAEYRAGFIARHPPEPSSGGGPQIIHKPPFADGDIFTGSPDGAKEFAVARVGAGNDRPEWRFRITSKDDPRMSPWRVVAIIVDEHGRCVLVDVLYEDRGPSGPGSLLDALDLPDR